MACIKARRTPLEKKEKILRSEGGRRIFKETEPGGGLRTILMIGVAGERFILLSTVDR